MIVSIPHNYTPRDYQRALFNCVADGYKRGVAVWHRRAGKDKTLINLITKEALKRVGSYYYFFPTYNQGRKILWDGMDRDGFKFLNHIPEELRRATNATEMKVTLVNDSLIQVVGSDRIDSIVGTNPIGCVFSEFALQDPTGWDFVRPILRENGGFAFFNYTPRGHNHGYKLFQMAQDNPEWFCESLGIDITKVLNEEDIDAERAAGMDEDLIQQEFYCSFEAAVPGAYYGTQLRIAREEGRITEVPYQDRFKVDTYWDLGVGDNTAIWFGQALGNEIHLIDYYESSGEGLGHYFSVLKEKGYGYGRHYAPHDIEARELSTGKTRREIAKNDYGFEFDVLPNISIDDGIEAVREIFPKCWIDKVKCDRGIECLTSYRKDYDEKNRVFRLRPIHDWASHGADAFRYMAIANGLGGAVDPLDIDKATDRT